MAFPPGGAGGGSSEPQEAKESRPSGRGVNNPWRVRQLPVLWANLEGLHEHVNPHSGFAHPIPLAARGSNMGALFPELRPRLTLTSRPDKARGHCPA